MGDISYQTIWVNEWVSVQWSGVRELKVLNDKLVFALENGKSIECHGLTHRQMDEIFIAYAHHLQEHELAKH
jgi:hypothetical protein